MKTSTFGNTCHILSSISVLTYTIATILYAKPGTNIFDSDWIEHGFCVIRKTVPYQNSHDLCLYFDTVLVLLGLGVYYSLKHNGKRTGYPHLSEQMKNSDGLMLFNLLGHLGHGIAHGFIATKYRSGEAFEDKPYSSNIEHYLSEDCPDTSEILKSTVIGLGFWFGLLKGIMPKLSTFNVAILAVIANFGGLFVRTTLGFAYVQAVLGTCFASTQLLLSEEEKDYGYAAFAAANVFLSIIPWIESIACQTKVVTLLGGHLMFDAAIPIFGTAAYVATWRHYTSYSSLSAQEAKEKKA